MREKCLNQIKGSKTYHQKIFITNMKCFKKLNMFDIALAPRVVDYFSVTWEQLDSVDETLLAGLEGSKN